MAERSLLGDLMGTLFERRRANTGDGDKRTLEQLCRALLETEAEISGLQLAATALGRIASLSAEDQIAFFRFLNDDLDVDAGIVRELAELYEAAPTPENYIALSMSAEPPRQELLRRLNRAPGATAGLVALRTDLLKRIRGGEGDLARLDHDYVHLLRSWFNRGFLVLRQITWNSAAAVLEKIIAYEAVHAINTWDDLRGRLHPPDRRLFAFFHPAMPDEPLIFVEVALTTEVPNSIQTLLSDSRDAIEAEAATTAVFYSISNCQAGLAGISFGNALIKQVARDLANELPNIKTFVTLSPIPGLMNWLRDQGQDAAATDPAHLQRWAALYLLDAKNPRGAPQNPVARFHLGNGARVLAVHAGADTSANGMAQSGGAMVNYHYDLAKITKYHQDYAAKNTVTATADVRALAKAARAERA